MNKIKYILLTVAMAFCLGNTDCDKGGKKHSAPRSENSGPASPIPEPGAGLVFAVGAAGMAYYFDRRRRSRK